MTPGSKCVFIRRMKSRQMRFHGAGNVCKTFNYFGEPGFVPLIMHVVAPLSCPRFSGCKRSWTTIESHTWGYVPRLAPLFSPFLTNSKRFRSFDRVLKREKLGEKLDLSFDVINVW